MIIVRDGGGEWKRETDAIDGGSMRDARVVVETPPAYRRPRTGARRW